MNHTARYRHDHKETIVRVLTLKAHKRMLVLGIVVIILARPKLLSRRQRKQEETSVISPKSLVYEAQSEAQPQAQ